MNAKEMFEKLGYELIGNCGGLTYSKKDKLLGDFIIRFESDYQFIKYYSTSNNIVAQDILQQKSIINMQTHQAITQQIKELGWIE
jgi:hypothetical protein